MSAEIERKFLVKKLPPELIRHKGKEIRQAYLCQEAHEYEIRIRAIDRDYYLTVKKGTGLIRQEVEISIPEKEFEYLWQMAGSQVITKTRYLCPYEGHVIELDIFSGKWSGLHLAEVEFPSEGESSLFVPPTWFGQEVTENPDYRNGNLARFQK